MKPVAMSLVATALALGLFTTGCAHRTTTVHRETETVRSAPREDVNVPPPAPMVDESTTVIKRSHTHTEEDQ